MSALLTRLAMPPGRSPLVAGVVYLATLPNIGRLRELTGVDYTQKSTVNTLERAWTTSQHASALHSQRKA